MGAQPNFEVSDHKGFLQLTHSGGSGAFHTGTVIGPRHSAQICDADSSKWPPSLDTFGRFAAIVQKCYDYRASLIALSVVDSHFASLTSTYSGAPWSVSPATFWSGLTSAQKESMIDAILQAVADARFSS